MTEEKKCVKYILPRRIETLNAAEVEEDLMAQIGEKLPDELTLDASKLEYISSAGLRVILKLQKKIPDVIMIDVSREIYPILEMTGFTSLLKVKRAIREISMEGLKCIGTGATGAAYRIDDERIVKLFTINSSLENVEREMENARKAFECGVPTCITFEVVKCGECYGIIYELINSTTLQEMLAADPQNEDLIRRYATMLRESGNLHFDHDYSTGPVFKYKLLSIVDRMKGVYFSEEEHAKVRRMLSETAEVDTFNHGDSHPGNVMVQGDEMLFIDMTTADSGDPIFDVASAGSAFDVYGRILDESSYQAKYGYSRADGERMWKLFLKYYYEGESADVIEERRKQAEGIASLKMLCGALHIKGLFSAENTQELIRIALQSAEL